MNIKNATAGALAVGSLGLLAACASAPHVTPAVKPPVSAAAACRDFTAWATHYLVTNQGQYPQDGYPVLHQAAAEAPSGVLYRNLSALDLAVSNPPPGASPVNPASGTAPNDYLLNIDTLTGQAADSCTAVNPAG